MGDTTKIEWADATFNPWVGCTKVSAGCKNCYAERDMDKRRGFARWGPGQERVRTSEANWRKVLTWERNAARTGTRPRVFCASLADWLDADGVPGQWLTDLLTLIALTPNLTWMLLTKRPSCWEDRMHDAVRATESPWLTTLSMKAGKPAGDLVASHWLDGSPPRNVWVGCTVEDQENTARIAWLADIPAFTRFLSCEPMLGPIDLEAVPSFLPSYDEHGSPIGGSHPIHWVICGGESGPGFRPMEWTWAVSLQDQCERSGVAFFFKQHAGLRPKELGRELNGVIWNQLPAGAL